MKFNNIKFIQLFFIISLILFSACQNQEVDNVAGYGFESAIISYEIKGSSTGSSEVIIKNNKKRIVENIQVTKVDGTQENKNNFYIQNGPKTYYMDTENKTGIIITNPKYLEIEKLPIEKRKERWLRELLRVEGESIPEPIRQDTVAGIVCDVYKVNYLENCVWEGIALRTVMSLPDSAINVTTEATKVVVNGDVSDSEFQIPAEYTITDPINDKLL